MKNKGLIIAQNRKAKFDYIITDEIEVGVVLRGAEVKSIRQGTVSLDSSYAVDKKGEFWVNNLHVDLKSSDKNQENIENIQKAFNHRAKMNGLSSKGKWSEDLEKESAA